MIRTWKERGLVLLAAAPLLGIVPMADGAHAEFKPPPRPRTQAEPKKPEPKKPEPKKPEPKKSPAPKKGPAPKQGVVLHTASPKKDVIPGRTYAWTFTVTAKGPGKSGKATFRTKLPKSLAFVSGEKHCAAAGRKVVCRLGTVRKGHRISGVIRAKVSGRARPGQKISPRGTVTWGETRVTRRFPAVRVAETAGHAVTKTVPAESRHR